MSRRAPGPGRSLTLRTRFILVILLGVIAPLAVAACWLTRTTRSSGEALLRSRMEQSLGEAVQTVGDNWLMRRSELLDLAEDPRTLAGLREGRLSLRDDDPGLDRIRQIWASLEGVVDRARLRDSQGEFVGTFDRGAEPVTAPGSAFGAALPLSLPIYDPVTGQALGSLEAELHLGALLPGGLWWSGVGGSVLAVFGGAGVSGSAAGAPEDAAERPLLPLPMEPSLLLEGDHFEWNGEGWLVVRHRLQDPPVLLALSAPVGPFTQPFSAAARRGVGVFIVVMALGIALATLLTRRMTGPLEQLARTAESVSRGDLDRTVGEEGPDEIRRVGRAFNAMTESLRRTLRKLSQQEAAAAVGEFAASLAHEVRNPLTSIRLDLERARENTEDERTLELLSRALAEIERLDSTVSGSLRVARSGNLTLEPIDLRQPLEAALHAAQPVFEARGTTMEPLSDFTRIVVKGDAGALEQLFLNLLRNAAEALGAGGRAWIEVEERPDLVGISVRDEGPGIPADSIGSILEPFFSTKSEGTGLGLPIAQRIARAHGGELTVESGPEGGAVVRVDLPRNEPEDAG